MTEDKAFKKQVRERAAKTGERYAAARARLASDRRPQVVNIAIANLRLLPLATDEARIRRHAFLDPVHMLLAVLDEGGDGLRLLEKMHVSPVAVRAAAERLLASVVASAQVWQSPQAESPVLPAPSEATRDLLKEVHRLSAERRVSPSQALVYALARHPTAGEPLRAFGATPECLEAVIDMAVDSP